MIFKVNLCESYDIKLPFDINEYFNRIIFEGIPSISSCSKNIDQNITSSKFNDKAESAFSTNLQKIEDNYKSKCLIFYLIAEH